MSELSYSLPSWDLHNLGSLFNQNFNLGIDNNDFILQFFYVYL